MDESLLLGIKKLRTSTFEIDNNFFYPFLGGRGKVILKVLIKGKPRSVITMFK